MVQARVIVVEHPPDPQKLSFSCNLNRSLALFVHNMTICPRDQQLLDNLAVPVACCKVQRGHPFQIDRVQLNVRLRQQIFDYLLTARKGSPVQGRAQFGVPGVDVELLMVEVEIGAGLVALSG